MPACLSRAWSYPVDRDELKRRGMELSTAISERQAALEQDQDAEGHA